MSDRTVSAVNRICKLILLLQDGKPRSIKQLHLDLEVVYGVKTVYSSVWRDLLTMEEHKLIERKKRVGHRGWLFKLKGISK